MEEGAKDETQSGFVDDLKNKQHGFGGMIEKLNNEKGWYSEDAEVGTLTGVKFLEGQEADVSYRYRYHAGGEETIDTQRVIVSTGADGKPERTLYSSLVYPELSAHPDDAEFYSVWDAAVHVGDVLGQDLAVYATQKKQMYEVTFRSDVDFGNAWSYNEAEGIYYLKVDMEYGATVNLGGSIQTVTDQNRTFDVMTADVPPFEGGSRSGKWQKDPVITSTEATFIAEYDPDTIIYVSEVAFTVEGKTIELTSVEGFEGEVYTYSDHYSTTYTVEPAPAAEGYLFLGWYTEQDGAWSKVEATLELSTEQTTVVAQALWMSNLSVEITKAERTNKREESSWFVKTTYYDYSVEATLTGGQLVGAFAGEETMTLTYSFDAYTMVLAHTIGSEQTETVTGYTGNKKVISAEGEKVQEGNKPRVHVKIAYYHNGTLVYEMPEELLVEGKWN